MHPELGQVAEGLVQVSSEHLQGRIPQPLGAATAVLKHILGRGSS